MVLEEMVITPDDAKRMLVRNSVNRSLSISRVKQYAEDMRSDRWQNNGESIKFYEDGSLADGQHRLNAIVIADKSIFTTVIYGLPMTVTIHDRGRNRDVTDQMVLDGMDSSLANNFVTSVGKLHFLVQGLGKQRNVSDGAIVDFIRRNASLLRKLNKICSTKCAKGTVNTRVAPIGLALFYGLNSKLVSEDAVRNFLYVLRTGMQDNIDETDASSAIICRNDIIFKNISFSNTTGRIDGVSKIEKALFDFSNNIHRSKSYKCNNNPVYSNHPSNMNA